MAEQRREYFRVEFPEGYRPRFTVSDTSYDVLDLSECGIRFHVGTDADFIIDTHVSGTLIFSDGEELACRGTVIRVESGTVAMHNETPVSLARVRSEHLNLIRHFYSKYY